MISDFKWLSGDFNLCTYGDAIKAIRRRDCTPLLDPNREQKKQVDRILQRCLPVYLMQGEDGQLGLQGVFLYRAEDQSDNSNLLNTFGFCEPLDDGSAVIGIATELLDMGLDTFAEIVFLHELAHLHEMNHGNGFQAVFNTELQDYFTLYEKTRFDGKPVSLKVRKDWKY